MKERLNIITSNDLNYDLKEYKYIFPIIPTVSVSSNHIILGSPEEFLDFKETFIDEYLKFLAEFSCASGLNNITCEGLNFFLFTEFNHRDTWMNSFLKNLIIGLYVEKLCREHNIEKMFFDGRDITIEQFVLEGESCPNVFRLLLRRGKLFVNLLRVKFKLGRLNRNLGSSIKPYMFLSCFPKDWNVSSGKEEDRFFGKFNARNEMGTIVFHSEPVVSGTSICLEDYVSYFDILLSFLNLKPLLSYINIRKKIVREAIFKGFDLRKIFIKQLNFSYIFNFLYFGVRTIALKRLFAAEGEKIKAVVTSGEYGMDGLCLVEVLKEFKIKSVFHQHSPFCPDRIWLRNNDFPDYPQPDGIITWTQRYKNRILDYNRSLKKESVHVVSNDGYSFAERIENKKQKSDFDYLFCPSLNEVEIDYYIQLMKVLDCPLSRIAFKVHPNFDRFFDFNKLIQKFPELNEVSFFRSEKTISELVQIVDVVIVGGSQVALEFLRERAKVLVYRNPYDFNFSPIDEYDKTFFTIDEFNSTRQDVFCNSKDNYSHYFQSSDLMSYREAVFKIESS